MLYAKTAATALARIMLDRRSMFRFTIAASLAAVLLFPIDVLADEPVPNVVVEPPPAQETPKPVSHVEITSTVSAFFRHPRRREDEPHVGHRETQPGSAVARF